MVGRHLFVQPRICQGRCPGLRKRATAAGGAGAAMVVCAAIFRRA